MNDKVIDFFIYREEKVIYYLDERELGCIGDMENGLMKLYNDLRKA